MYERQSIHIKDQSGEVQSHHQQLESMKHEIYELYIIYLMRKYFFKILD